MREIQTRLMAPFDDSDIEWRLQWVNDEKTSGIAVPYVTNRAIQSRLDSAVGIGGWKNEYIPWHSDGKKASQICGISIYYEDRKEWITKYDGAEDSDIEAVKGGLSDSMKRAAVQWGIGRYLYEMDSVYVDVEMRNRTPLIKRSEHAKLNETHQKTVRKVFGAGPAKTPSDTSKKDTPVSSRQTEAANPRSPIPDPAIPEGSYFVLGVAYQPSVKGGHNTNLQLKGRDGKVIQAYMQGTNPAIAQGVWILNPKITQKMKEGIVFYTLDAFELAAPRAA